jgi:hypothetical protein
VWWYTSVIPTLRGGDRIETKASPGYIVETLFQENNPSHKIADFQEVFLF